MSDGVAAIKSFNTDPCFSLPDDYYVPNVTSLLVNFKCKVCHPAPVGCSESSAVADATAGPFSYLWGPSQAQARTFEAEIRSLPNNTKVNPLSLKKCNSKL